MQSLMFDEARQSAQVVAHMLSQDDAQYTAWAQQVASHEPRQILTVARGSSDHAASYLAYLLTMLTGHVVASLPLSHVSLNHAALQVQHTLAIALSQSGRSPDLLATMQSLEAQGATTTALVNDPASPLAALAQWSFPLRAGPEKSVAATKSYIASLAVSARLAATLHRQRGGGDALLIALSSLPEVLDLATRLDWSVALDIFRPRQCAMVLGRGLGLALAQEAALKLKETACMQAEAFSGAEVLHGPMALIEKGYPLLIFALPGAALPAQRQLARDMRQRGATVYLVGASDVPEADLRLPEMAHEALAPLVAAQAFYLFAEQLSREKGLNPDLPRHLNKVTLTV